MGLSNILRAGADAWDRLLGRDPVDAHAADACALWEDDDRVRAVVVTADLGDELQVAMDLAEARREVTVLRAKLAEKNGSTS